MNRSGDSDDWFDLDEPGGSRGSDAAGEEGDEDWLRDVPPPPRPWFETVDRRVVVVAAVGLIFLIAVLAAAGVFSSSPKTSVPPVTTPLITTTSTTQTTTTTPAKAVPAPTTNLKPGDTGTQVKVLQRALAHLGFSAGKADAQYGPATEAAVKQFQTAKGLTADGLVGPSTLAALKTALRG